MKVKNSKKSPKKIKTKTKSLKKAKKTSEIEADISKHPEWKTVKLSGNLLSDEGGIGLEGLLGLEVLENASSLSIEKQKHVKVKKGEKKYIPDENSGDESESDDGGGRRGGKNARKKKKKLLKKKMKKEAEKTGSTPGRYVLLRPPNAETEEKPSGTENNGKQNKKSKKSKKSAPEGANPEADESALTIDDLIGWNGLGIPEPILKVMAEKCFKEPTEIQALTFPSAILGRRDILGAAETGSGKTLAFGIPILTGIMHMKNQPGKAYFRKLSKKILSRGKNPEEAAHPTTKQSQNHAKQKKNKRNREDRDNWTPPPEEINNFSDLAFEQIEKLQNGDDSGSGSDSENEESNERDSKPLYALILTPTRELAVQVKDHLVTAAKYTGIKVAAIFGGLAAVKQERVLSKCPEIVVATPGRLWELISEGNEHLNKLENINFLVVDETDRMVEKGHFEELKQILERLNANSAKKEQRQNFIFSATLTLMHDLPQYLKTKNLNRKRKLQPETSDQKIQALIDHFGISQPKIVDITPKQTTGGTAQKLTECRISCSHNQKDLYLYYFLQKHPGRTIVFCNSIDCVRRLTKLFTILNCEPRALHAQMAQRARLKNLERFTKSPTGLLIATDVAARGLDIPNVEHVIHYQVPRTSENYIHRSGRTARGNKEGIAILMMEPGEVNVYMKLCRTLKRNEDLPIFPVADRYLAAVRERVNLATQIDIKELQLRRKNADIGWIKKSAKEMDILVDDESDFSEADLYDSDDGGGAIERTLEARELKQLQGSLKRLLATPIFPKGYCYKYPSSMNIDSNASHMLKAELGRSHAASSHADGAESSENAIDVMKNAIEENKNAKKQRNKKLRPL